MSRPGFRPSLLVALLAVLVAAGTLGVLALGFMADLDRRSQELAERNMVELAVSARLAETIHAYRGLQFRIADEAQPGERRALARVLSRTGRDAERLVDRFVDVAADRDDREEVAAVGREFARYRMLTEGLDLGSAAGRGAAARLTGAAEPVFLSAAGRLRAVQDGEQAEADATAAAGRRAYERYRLAFALAVSGALLLVAALGLWLLVVRPVRRNARLERFRRRLRGGLEMAEDEPQALDVAARAIREAGMGVSCELLLADRSESHLRSAMQVPGPGCPEAACGVATPRACPAVRRGRLVAFASGEALDACPWLRGRPDGPCSAVCTPVNVLGHTVGVLHAAGPDGHEAHGATRDRLEELAAQVGARLGVLRAMARSRLQASTDPLTGLLNRRSLEERARALRLDGIPVSVAMADLDHFKRLNDTHGHDTGDRALRAFARVLGEAVRQEDLVCRYGGEEFVLVLPRCSAADAAETAERVRAGLRGVVGLGGIPAFTCSFGVAEAAPDESLEETLRLADATLFEAKRAGRDRVCVAAGVRPAHAVPSGDGAPLSAA